MTPKNEFKPFEGDIQRFEAKLVQFVVESGKYKFDSEIEAHLIAYIVLYQKFTQNLLKKVSKIHYKKDKKRGISSGSISKYVNRFLDWGFIDKKSANDNSPLLVYKLKDEIKNLIFSAGGELGARIFIDAYNFYAEKLHYLENIPFKAERQSKDCLQLITRLKELLRYIKEHGELLLQYFKKKNPKIGEVDFPKFSQLKLKKISKFNKTVEEIEVELIEYTSKNRLFTFQNSSHTKIYAVFVIKKRVTQNILKKTRGFSSGVISEGVRYLLEHDLITKHKIPGERKKYYLMNSVAYANFTRFHERLQIVTYFKPILEKMIFEIEECKNKLRDLHGFREISENLHSFEQLMPVYERFEKLLKEKITRKQK